jgi:hypothetical protein
MWLLLALLACRSDAPKSTDPTNVPTDPGTSDDVTVVDTAAPGDDDDDTTTPIDTAGTSPTGTPSVDTGDPPRPLLCPPADLEVCGNGLDDDGDGLQDCAFEGWQTTPWARLQISDASELFAPGDITGDGIPDLVTFAAVDNPVHLTRTSVYPAPFAAGDSAPAHAVRVDAQGYTARTPVLRDADADGAVDMVLGMIIEEGWTCTSNLPWEVYHLELPTSGDLDAATAAAATLGHPDWAEVMPTVYTHPVGDLDDDGVDDVMVISGTCSDWAWFVVPGGAFTQDERVTDVAIATLLDPQGPETPSRAYDAGDVDGDGRDDLVLSTVDANGDARIYVFTEPLPATIDLGDATWVFTTPGVPQEVRAADLSLDGVPDLIVSVAFDEAGVFVIENDPRPPAGSVRALRDVAWAIWEAPVGSAAVRAEVADLNGDGQLDLAIGVFGDGVHVDHAPCAGVHALPADGVGGTYANTFTILDADHDGHPDLLLPTEFGDALGVTVFRGGPR